MKLELNSLRNKLPINKKGREGAIHGHLNWDHREEKLQTLKILPSSYQLILDL